ncbi:MAG: hypothetical protein QM734_07105 [Cyclobacteriaceae bacterium]
MRVSSARIVLTLFILSASIVQLVELGHSALHSFKNPFHYHKASSVKDFKDHSLADHNFPKMQFAYEMDEAPSPNNFVVIAFGFFQSFLEYKCSYSFNDQTHFTMVIEPSYSFSMCPPTPPPLGSQAS